MDDASDFLPLKQRDAVFWIGWGVAHKITYFLSLFEANEV